MCTGDERCPCKHVAQMNNCCRQDWKQKSALCDCAPFCTLIQLLSHSIEEKICILDFVFGRFSNVEEENIYDVTNAAENQHWAKSRPACIRATFTFVLTQNIKCIVIRWKKNSPRRFGEIWHFFFIVCRTVHTPNAVGTPSFKIQRFYFIASCGHGNFPPTRIWLVGTKPGKSPSGAFLRNCVNLSEGIFWKADFHFGLERKWFLEPFVFPKMGMRPPLWWRN